MPAEVAATSGTGPLPRSRPTTRSSIRQSLTLANMGKALADVMHKEKDGVTEKERTGRKTRESTTKRGSAAPTASAAALEKLSSGKKEVAFPSDTKTVTRNSRRTSTLQSQKSSCLTSSDDQSSSSPAGDSPKRPLTRSSSLKPRARTSGSALPKYRPRSVLIENVKTPPSPPARVGTRRRLSSISDEMEVTKQLLGLEVPESKEKNGRAISPLPHRGALKVNLTGAINVRPATPEKKSKASTPTPTTSPSKRQSSPSRLPTTRGTASKTAKSPASAVTPTAASTAARPSSSASSTSSSPNPHTPTPTLGQRISQQSGGSARLKTSQGPGTSPLRSSVPPHPDSPLTQASLRKIQRNHSPTPSPSPRRLMPLGGTRSLIRTPGPIMADSSIDSIDASDVEYMLASTASSTAPTPSLPRFRTVRAEPDENPHTPPRQVAILPTRSNMSYLSPVPPTSESSPFLRPNRPRLTAGVDRGSILSWEQLAQHNRAMGQDDVDNMLHDIDAPFRSATASPAPSTLPDIPESPSLSALPSPTGYGSISQVLLPDVTPSPAIFNATLRFDHAVAESPIGDSSGATTMLKLQLAAAESAANEQRLRIEALEAQLLSAKEARLRDTEELAHQVTVLEQQVQGSLRADEQLQQQVVSLEERLACAQIAQEQAVGEALKRAQRDAVRAQEECLKTYQLRWTASTFACKAGAAWGNVKTTAESEVDYIRSSREMLSVLLTGLDQSLQHL